MLRPLVVIWFSNKADIAADFVIEHTYQFVMTRVRRIEPSERESGWTYFTLPSITENDMRLKVGPDPLRIVPSALPVPSH